MTKRAGKRKNRQGVGPLKPPPGPSGPMPVENSCISGKDNLPAAESLSMSMQALRQGWLLTADTKVREGLIMKMLTVAGEIAKKPIEKMSDPDFDRMLAIFRTVASVEQRQQQLEIARAMAEFRINNPSVRPVADDLPEQVTPGDRQADSEATPSVAMVEPWEAVQRLLSVDAVIDAVKTKPNLSIASEPSDLESRHLATG